MSSSAQELEPEAGALGPEIPVERAPRSTGEFVSWRIARIQREYTAYPQTAASRAALARLRRGVGKGVGEVPDVMPYVVNESAPRPGTEVPTADEVAIHTALTLYAVHQQSQNRPMHLKGTSFGTALGHMRFQGGVESPGVVRRFQALGTATDFTETASHARALITLLRAAGRGFDYGRFAQDLVALQDPERSTSVRLSWGRDFYRVKTTSESTEEQQA